MTHRVLAPLALSLLAASVAACSGAPEEGFGDDDDLASAYSSSEAVLMDFEFDGQLVTDATWDLKNTIEDQMLYTIGHLNGDRSVGRLDALELTNIQQAKQPDGTTKVTYHAKLPVSWGKKNAVPTSYDFTLPKNASYQGYEAFTKAYMHTCVEAGAHDVDSGSMWYYYRPTLGGCALAATDVVKLTATAKVSKLNTTGKYPEFDKVWEDGELNVVSVFGKFEDGKTTGDVGIDGFNTYVAAVRNELAAFKPTTSPATVPANPGVAVPDVSFSATLPGGKKVNVSALLVDNVSSAPQTFYDRYEGLSTKADLISYNGHAGLGQNVRALAKKGKFVKGKYLMVFMNGCDTFAYVDGSLAQTRAVLNADDPTGTKYMDIVTNTMPSYFSSMPLASMALLRGLMKFDGPQTYQQIFQNVDSSQAVVVTGEEDNAFAPSQPPPPPAGEWKGLTESFNVARQTEKRFAASKLPAGTYSFVLDGTGDADLYVKVGTAPTTKTYDCRPFLGSSKERCEVKLKETSDVYVMVRGYAATSAVKLVGRKQ